MLFQRQASNLISVLLETLKCNLFFIIIVFLSIFFFKQSGKASLGVDIYHALAAESIPVEEVLLSLNMETEHSVLDMVNQLEGAVFAWKQRITEETMKKSPIRYPWSFVKENGSELEKRVVNLERAKALLHLLRIRFPNLPQSFIDVTKVQHNKVISFLPQIIFAKGSVS